VRFTTAFAHSPRVTTLAICSSTPLGGGALTDGRAGIAFECALMGVGGWGATDAGADMSPG
jgi:hypothetical protein